MARVLIADDEPAARSMIRDAVTADAGLTICAEAANGAEAVELTREHRPDVVLMDVTMPELDGIAATRRILEAHPGARIVVLTASEDDELRELALHAGASDCLIKTAGLAALPAAIARAIGTTTGDSTTDGGSGGSVGDLLGVQR